MRRIIPFLGALFCAVSTAQLRVVTYNISNYGGGRNAAIQTAIFASFNNLSLNPDVMICQEFLSAAAQTEFLNTINTAAGSSGTWAATPFTDGNDTDNACFYRADRLVFLTSTIISVGDNAPDPPRDTKRYDFRLMGYSTLQPKFAVYSCHLKAGTTSSDLSRRLTEATRIRTDAQNLGSSYWGFIVGGDFNIQSSSESSYTKFVGTESNNNGRFFDPISTPGAWDGSSSFRYVHTQDPDGGMNSRYDFLLASASLLDGVGFDYIGAFGTPYSTTAWNDPNHSYRSWGNDGGSFGNPLRTTTNTMVGQSIAQALITLATTAGGHLPVLMDLRVPAETEADRSILDLGTVLQGGTLSATFNVYNSTSATLWRTGVAALNYTLSANNGFSAPTGTFVDQAGGGMNPHSVSVSTTTSGAKSGTLTITPSDPRGNVRQVSLVANVIANSIPPDSVTPTWGTVSGGNLASLGVSDDNRYGILTSLAPRGLPNAEIEVTGTCPNVAFNRLDVILEVRSAISPRKFLVRAWDYAVGQWEYLSARGAVSGTDQTFTVTTTNPQRFLEPGTRKMKLRTGVLMYETTPWLLEFDQVRWNISL